LIGKESKNLKIAKPAGSKVAKVIYKEVV